MILYVWVEMSRRTRHDERCGHKKSRCARTLKSGATTAENTGKVPIKILAKISEKIVVKNPEKSTLGMLAE